jgi:hypothetical protein
VADSQAALKMLNSNPIFRNAVLLLAVVPAFGSQIVSGTVDRVFGGDPTGPFSITLQDGYSLSGISIVGEASEIPQCFIGPEFRACTFSPHLVFKLNDFGFPDNPLYSGSFTITIPSGNSFAVDTSKIPRGASVVVPFNFVTVTGRLVAPFTTMMTFGSADPCLLLTPDVPGVCIETISGSGTGTVTLIHDPNSTLDRIYMQSETLSFSVAPEPSTMAFCTIAGFVAVCRRRRRT